MVWKDNGSKIWEAITNEWSQTTAVKSVTSEAHEEATKSQKNLWRALKIVWSFRSKQVTLKGFLGKLLCFDIHPSASL